MSLQYYKPSVHTNVGGDNQTITLAGDKRFGLGHERVGKREKQQTAGRGERQATISPALLELFPLSRDTVNPPQHAAGDRNTGCSNSTEDFLLNYNTDRNKTHLSVEDNRLFSVFNYSYMNLIFFLVFFF
jgi:hypothetical protein